MTNETEWQEIQDPKTISIMVNNKPGVLMRLAQTFARRGYNIDSLVVSRAHDPRFSRITIVTQGDPQGFDQIIRQLNKLIDVVHAYHHVSESSVERELALFKMSANSEDRVEVFQIAEVFRAKNSRFHRGIFDFGSHGHYREARCARKNTQSYRNN